jgi:membrane-bound serine protease (ClpP class)
MRGREYTILAIAVSLLEAGAVAAVVLWLLPQWGFRIPVWGLILLMLAFGIYQFVTYRLGRRAIVRNPVISLEAMVGRYGEVTIPLTPDGYVQLDGELWRASSVGTHADKGDEVIVREVKGLTLIVAPQSKKSGSGK